MFRKQTPRGIVIVQDSGQLVLSINGHRVETAQAAAAALACLYDDLGRVVPYARLISVRGRLATAVPTVTIDQRVLISRDLGVHALKSCGQEIYYTCLQIVHRASDLDRAIRLHFG
jgi:hypothetical protein